MAPDVVLYSDFNCPFCYALNERILGLSLGDRIEWRGVEHAPDLPARTRAGDARLAAALEQEVWAVRRLAPELPIVRPAGKPSTGLATRWVAAAFEADPVRAHSFKDALYRELWQRGGDLADEALLREVAHAHGFGDELRPEEHRARVEEWRHAWIASGTRAVPAAVRAGGGVLLGLVSRPELAGFVAGADEAGDDPAPISGAGNHLRRQSGRKS